MSIIDCTSINLEHEWENIGYSERIDNETVAVEYECLNCGKTDFEYYYDELIEDVENY
ncbi:MAG: hypothetical protein ACE5SW_11680 [Nitrososphaeraceae archaeon]